MARELNQLVTLSDGMRGNVTGYTSTVSGTVRSSVAPARRVSVPL